MEKNFGKLVGLVGVVIIGLILLLMSVTTIGAGQIGIVTLFGKVQAENLSSGIHLLNPIASVHKVNVQVQTVSEDSQAQSNDVQQLKTTLTLNYSINPTKVNQLFILVGGDKQQLEAGIIQPALNEAFKSVVAKYQAVSLIDQRTQVSNDLVVAIQNKLSKYGIEVQSVSITGFGFSQVFNDTIEQKVAAAQILQKMDIQLKQSQVTAQQKIVEAQADATAMNLRKQAVTPELISLKQLELQQAWVNKWNGSPPQTIVGGNNWMNLMMGNK